MLWIVNNEPKSIINKIRIVTLVDDYKQNIKHKWPNPKGLNYFV